MRKGTPSLPALIFSRIRSCSTKNGPSVWAGVSKQSAAPACCDELIACTLRANGASAAAPSRNAVKRRREVLLLRLFAGGCCFVFKLLPWLGRDIQYRWSIEAGRRVPGAHAGAALVLSAFKYAPCKSMKVDTVVADEFPVVHNLVYLNHAGIGPLPRRTAAAINDFARACLDYGARDYPRWIQTEQRLREALAALINAPSSDDIALVKNTSEGLSMVAHGFPWRDGDNVIISDQEFPSNRIVWESLSRYGVSLREVDLASAATPEQALLAHADARTRLIAISSVQFATGLRIDLAALGQQCRARGVALCADAIQAVGCIDQDVQRMQIDFLVADGHKWMLAPEGLGVFYCAQDWRERLQLFEYGWHMRERSGDHESHDWTPAVSARRFECGSPNLLGAHAFLASVDLLREIGGAEIEKRVLERSRFLFDRIQAREDLELVTDTRTGRYAGIVTFRSRKMGSGAMMQRLRDANVVCAERAGGIRLSPHFYTPLEQLEQALEVV